MKSVAALGFFVAIATAVCPLRICFTGDDLSAVPAAPGTHGHDHHEGPDTDAGCCTDVPTETGGPWFVVHLDLPTVHCAELASCPRAPHTSSTPAAPRVAPARTTVLLR